MARAEATASSVQGWIIEGFGGMVGLAEMLADNNAKLTADEQGRFSDYNTRFQAAYKQLMGEEAWPKESTHSEKPEAKSPGSRPKSRNSTKH